MKSNKEHIGFVVGDGHSMNAAAIKKIVAAETAGIRQMWMNQEYLDTLTIFAAAATKTSTVRFGTADKTACNIHDHNDFSISTTGLYLLSN
jgi:alkanesulfonate monooxygenase SsuD/methylene tetrahydromethanopterin reductase-like flavin-dependent oxidoreductase (luciferase family)